MQTIQQSFACVMLLLVTTGAHLLPYTEPTKLTSNTLRGVEAVTANNLQNLLKSNRSTLQAVGGTRSQGLHKRRSRRSDKHTHEDLSDAGERAKRMLERVGTDEMRAKAPKVYDVDDSCKIHWKKTAKELLIPWAESGVQRESLGRVPLAALTHTPMWLRIVKGRLHCVRDPRFKRLRLRMKLYRAMHYIIRVNRVVDSRGLPEGTEWWTQHSDFLKVKPDFE